MDNNKLISVIVPIYGVEAYLDRCIRSLTAQSHRALEIILVDDGSPDGCPAMCDTWAERDPRIQVIHKKNGGLSDARNAGMAAATGAFTSFIDSDDWIEPNMYELLLRHMEQDEADISVCGVIMDWEDDTPSRMLTKEGSCVLSREDAMRAIVEESWLKQPVWYKLYKTELIRNISFPVGKYHEDVFWSYQAVAAAQKVSVFDTPCYHYIQRAGSIMGVGYSLKRLDAIEAKIQRFQFLQTQFPALLPNAQADLLFTCLYHGQMALQYLQKPEQNAVFASLKNSVCLVGPLSSHTLNGRPLSHKVWLFGGKFCIELTCFLRNTLHIGN